MPFTFSVAHSDAGGKARTGRLITDHGAVDTPVFMPVGTIGTVKTLTPADLREAGVQMALANTYHLYLRPGLDLLRQVRGLHRLNRWDGPIPTDSGGFQIYSLSDLKTISEEGVEFRSHWDGSAHLFTPENVVDTQRAIGSDVMMVLDYLTGNPSEFELAREAHRTTLLWAERARRRFQESEPLYDYGQAQFGIVQGGIYDDLRAASAEGLMALDFEGYAIGGLAVGEPRDVRRRVTDFCTDRLPADRPRYLMGVGKPEDILDGIELGVDMFDCVIPSRNARNGSVFTAEGRLNLRNARFRTDEAPLDATCPCMGCRTFSRAYLAHMLHVDEMLVLRLLTLHNITFYQRLTAAAREAIRADRFGAFKREFLGRYGVPA